jgi:hypothetical protein
VSPRSVGNTEREAAQWRAKLASKQVVTVAQPYEPPRHTPTPEAERILTVDLASARAQAQEAAPATSCEGGGQCPTFARAIQNVAAMATLLDMLPHPPPMRWIGYTAN